MRAQRSEQRLGLARIDERKGLGQGALVLDRRGELERFVRERHGAMEQALLGGLANGDEIRGHCYRWDRFGRWCPSLVLDRRRGAFGDERHLGQHRACAGLERVMGRSFEGVIGKVLGQRDRGREEAVTGLQQRQQTHPAPAVPAPPTPGGGQGRARLFDRLTDLGALVA